MPAPSPDTGRQEVLDSTIKQKIHEELTKLRKQEEEVQKQIQLALEKENIENQSKSWFSGGDKGQSSALLQQELDRVKQTIEKYNKQRDVSSFPGLKEARDAVISCYRYVRAPRAMERNGPLTPAYSEKPERSLDCWKQVEDFKHAVAKAEKVRTAGGPPPAAQQRMLTLADAHGRLEVAVANRTLLPPRPRTSRPATHTAERPVWAAALGRAASDQPGTPGVAAWCWTGSGSAWGAGQATRSDQAAYRTTATLGPRCVRFAPVL